MNNAAAKKSSKVQRVKDKIGEVIQVIDTERKKSADNKERNKVESKKNGMPEKKETSNYVVKHTEEVESSNNKGDSRFSERYGLRTPATAVGGGVGGAVGLVVGTVVGGPPGAVIGTTLGGAIGKAFGEVAVVAVDVAQDVGKHILKSRKEKK